jgi:hypothetical protein
LSDDDTWKSTPDVIASYVEAGNWTSYIFCEGEEPETPKFSTSDIEGDPIWKDCPDSEGIWWMSMATINGDTDEVIGEWSKPIKVTGETGGFYEKRYKISD